MAADELKPILEDVEEKFEGADLEEIKSYKEW